MRTIHQYAGAIRQISGRHGDFVYNANCKWVGKALEYYGEYCEGEVELFRRILRVTDVVWEIGANMGAQSVPLARLVSRGAFVGFEPQVEIFKILAANLCLNDLPRARCLNLALGPKSGTIELPPVNYLQPANFGAVSLTGQGGSGILVEQRRIDDLTYLPPPGLLKIDVEGMEESILRGGVETLRAHRPILYVENDQIDKSESLIEFLWGLDYDLYWHITPYYNVNNYFEAKTNLYGLAGSFNMLGLHKSTSFKIEDSDKISDARFHPLREMLASPPATGVRHGR